MYSHVYILRKVQFKSSTEVEICEQTLEGGGRLPDHGDVNSLWTQQTTSFWSKTSNILKLQNN